MASEKIKVHPDERWMNGFPMAGESMWADPVGDGLARLDNVPFFTRGLALRDVVSYVERDGLREIESVVEVGGQVPMVAIVADGIGIGEVRDALRWLFPDIACEGGFASVLSLSVPSADNFDVQRMLRLLARRGRLQGWEVTR